MTSFFIIAGMLLAFGARNAYAIETTIAPSAMGITNLASLYSLVQVSAQWLVVFGVMIGAVLVIWGGVQYIISGGDDEGVAAAKGRIYAALIGIALILLAYSVINIVGSFLGAGQVVS